MSAPDVSNLANAMVANAIPLAGGGLVLIFIGAAIYLAVVSARPPVERLQPTYKSIVYDGPCALSGCDITARHCHPVCPLCKVVRYMNPSCRVCASIRGNDPNPTVPVPPK